MSTGIQRWRAVLLCGAHTGKPVGSHGKEFCRYAGNPTFIRSQGHYFSEAAAVAACTRLPIPDEKHECPAFFRQDETSDHCDCGSYSWVAIETHAAGHQGAPEGWQYEHASVQLTRDLLDGEDRAHEAPFIWRSASATSPPRATPCNGDWSMPATGRDAFSYIPCTAGLPDPAPTARNPRSAWSPSSSAPPPRCAQSSDGVSE